MGQLGALGLSVFAAQAARGAWMLRNLGSKMREIVKPFIGCLQYSPLFFDRMTDR